MCGTKKKSCGIWFSRVRLWEQNSLVYNKRKKLYKEADVSELLEFVFGHSNVTIEEKTVPWSHKRIFAIKLPKTVATFAENFLSILLFSVECWSFSVDLISRQAFPLLSCNVLCSLSFEKLFSAVVHCWPSPLLGLDCVSSFRRTFMYSVLAIITLREHFAELEKVSQRLCLCVCV